MDSGLASLPTYCVASCVVVCPPSFGTQKKIKKVTALTTSTRNIAAITRRMMYAVTADRRRAAGPGGHPPGPADPKPSPAFRCSGSFGASLALLGGAEQQVVVHAQVGLGDGDVGRRLRAVEQVLAVDQRHHGGGVDDHLVDLAPRLGAGRGVGVGDRGRQRGVDVLVVELLEVVA